MKRLYTFFVLLCAPLAGAQELFELQSADAQNRDYLGSSLAVWGTSIALGAPGEDAAGPEAGAVYVFHGAASDWSQAAKLTPPDISARDDFGRAVSLSGTTLLAGSRLDDHVNGSGADEGSAYVFARSGSAWSVQQKLVASDAAPLDYFGSALDVDQDLAVIGAPFHDGAGADSGAAYVFARSGGTWTEAAKLLPADGAPGDLFGQSVAISGETVVVGAREDDDAGVRSGSAYVFVLSGGVWTEQAKLTASDAAGGDAFGCDVDVLGDLAIVGAFQADAPSSNSGAAYVFERLAGVWTETAKLTAADAGVRDDFGGQVALRDGVAAVGAPGDRQSGPSSGSVYLFRWDGGAWVETDTYQAAEAASGDFFGQQIDLHGTTLVVGSAWDDDAGNNSGSAHVFDVGPEPGVASCFGVGCPCSNDDPAAGCANSTGVGGVLTGIGSPSVSADVVVLLASQLPPQNNGLFYMGDSTVQNPFFDGFQCALGTTFRFLGSIQNSGSSGTMTLGPGIVADSGGLIQAATTWSFHAWHRDVPGTPCGTGANLTHLYSVTFTP